MQCRDARAGERVGCPYVRDGHPRTGAELVERPRLRSGVGPHVGIGNADALRVDRGRRGGQGSRRAHGFARAAAQLALGRAGECGR
jgi:hypothetical protein